MPTSSVQHVTGGPLPYLRSAPAVVEPGRSAMPLLCFLHGYDEAAPMAIERALTLHGPLAARSLAIAREQFVVVAPQLPRAGDHWRRFGSAVEAIIDATHETMGTDGTRTYLSGFSFGGNGVLDLAAENPTRWAAIWPVDPTRVPARDPGVPVWLSIGAAARPHARGFVSRLGLERVRDDRSAAPYGDRLYLDEGLDHVRSAASAYADARIYAWLLAHSTRPVA